jgi:hypothetical protein
LRELFTEHYFKQQFDACKQPQQPKQQQQQQQQSTNTQIDLSEFKIEFKLFNEILFEWLSKMNLRRIVPFYMQQQQQLQQPQKQAASSGGCDYLESASSFKRK